MRIFENLQHIKALAGEDSATGRGGWSGQKKKLKNKDYRLNIPLFPAKIRHFYRANHRLYSNLAVFCLFGFLLFKTYKSIIPKKASTILPVIPVALVRGEEKKFPNQHLETHL